MKKLTVKRILKVVNEFRDECRNDFDWWYGDTASFTNAEYGYDMNVFEPEDGAERSVTVYKLGPKDKDGFQSMTDEVVLNFKIEGAKGIWRKKKGQSMV